jgi:type III pantothenate kinase
MLLTIDISNTSIKAGVFKGDDLLGHWRIATERQKLADDYGMLLLNLLKTSGFSAGEVKGVSMSCVVPPLKAVFDELAKKYLHSTPLIVRPDIVTGVKLSVDNPREVGADRVVNSLATYRLYGGPAIAIAFRLYLGARGISGRGDRPRNDDFPGITHPVGRPALSGGAHPPA